MKVRADHVARLEEMCIDIYAYCDLDCEITLAGNGTSCGEAANVADEILILLFGNRNDWSKKNDPKIKRRAKELRLDYGEEE